MGRCLVEIACSSVQVENFARESEEWKSRAAEWKAGYDTMEAEARKERSQREAFERKLADMEKLNDRLQQDRPVSFTD